MNLEFTREWAAKFRLAAAAMPDSARPKLVPPVMWRAQRESYLSQADDLDAKARELEQSCNTLPTDFEHGGFNRYGYDHRPEGWNDSVMSAFFDGPELRVPSDDYRAAFSERAAVPSPAPIVYDSNNTSAPPCAGGAGATIDPPLGAPAFPATPKAQDPMPMTFTDRARLAWRILRAKADSNSLKHAERELLLAFPPDRDSSEGDLPGWNDAIRHDILEVLLVFAIQGHSGGSASVAIPTIQRLMQQEPLTPITGEDDQWNECGAFEGATTFQHRRCSHVFKENVDGQPYTLDGYVFREPVDPSDPDGYRGCFTGKGSARAITFPWVPVPAKVVDVDAEGNRIDGLPRLAIMPEIEEDTGYNPVRTILLGAAKQFRDYQSHHLARWEAMTEHERERDCWKEDGSSLQKSGVNQRWAEQLELTAEALAR